jgi:cold shock CspA family protein
MKISKNGFNSIIEGSKTQRREQGDIISFEHDRRHGFIQKATGQRVFFPIGNVQPDGLLSRAWSFVENTPVTFIQVQRLTRSGEYKSVATDVSPLFPFDEVEDMESRREVSTVLTLSGPWGFARREDGDDVFFHRSDVLSEFSKRWEFVKSGVPIYHGIKIGGKDGMPRASCIELYSPQELAEPVPVPGPEVLSAEPAAAHKSELLRPENRSKTLYELIQERRS